MYSEAKCWSKTKETASNIKDILKHPMFSHRKFIWQQIPSDGTHCFRVPENDGIMGVP